MILFLAILLATNTLAIGVLMYTNALMRMSAINEAASTSLLLAPGGRRIEKDLAVITAALDRTFPYNQKLDYAPLIAIQSLSSVLLFGASAALFGMSTAQCFVVAISTTLMASLAILDAKTTWLPRQHSVALSLFLAAAAAYEVNPLIGTLTDALVGGLFGLGICFIGNKASQLIKQQEAVTQGDAYYLAAIGFLLGANVLIVLLVAVILQVIITTLKLLSSPEDGEGHAPFGPALCLAALGVLVVGYLT